MRGITYDVGEFTFAAATEGRPSYVFTSEGKAACDALFTTMADIVAAKRCLDI